MTRELLRALNEANELHLTDGADLLCTKEPSVRWWVIDGPVQREADLTCIACRRLLVRILNRRIVRELRTRRLHRSEA